MQPKLYGAAAEYNRPQNQGMGRRLLLIGGVGIGVIMLISILWMVVSAITSGPQQEATRLVARQQQLQRFIVASQPRIKNSELAKINSEAATFILSDYITLVGALRSQFGGGDLPQEIVASETDTTSEKQLQSASQANQFDRVYAGLLRDKFAASLQLGQSVASAQGGTLKSAAQQSITTISQLDERLSKLNL